MTMNLVSTYLATGKALRGDGGSATGCCSSAGGAGGNTGRSGMMESSSMGKWRVSWSGIFTLCILSISRLKTTQRSALRRSYSGGGGVVGKADDLDVDAPKVLGTTLVLRGSNTAVLEVLQDLVVDMFL